MTTFAFRDGILVSDTQVTVNSHLRIGRMQKIGKIGPFLYAASGNAVHVRQFMEWCSGGFKGNPPAMHADVGDTTHKAFGVLFLGGSRILMFDPEGPNFMEVPYYSDGSGSDLALGAMAYGASALEAVEIAAKHDIYSSGPFTILKTGPDQDDNHDF